MYLYFIVRTATSQLMRLKRSDALGKAARLCSPTATSTSTHHCSTAASGFKAEVQLPPSVFGHARARLHSSCGAIDPTHSARLFDCARHLRCPPPLTTAAQQPLVSILNRPASSALPSRTRSSPPLHTPWLLRFGCCVAFSTLGAAVGFASAPPRQTTHCEFDLHRLSQHFATPELL